MSTDNLEQYPQLSALMARSFLAYLDISRATIDAVVAETNSSIGYLHKFNEATQSISLGVWSKDVAQNCQTTHHNHYPLKEAGVWADSIRQRQLVVHNDYEQSTGNLPDGHFPLRNHMSIPIVRNDEIVAVIGVGNRDGGFDSDSQERFKRLVDPAWNCLQKKVKELVDHHAAFREKFEEQDEMDVLVNMTQALSRAFELRDGYTSLHQMNVAEICTMIGKKLNWPSLRLQGLRIGASLHDIGKIGVPIAVLNKTGKLNAAEFELVKLHSEYGANVFVDLEFPWDIYSMILQHHERMDGSGYPQGLTGSEICMEARIIAVADTFDAIRNSRPYRKALGIDHAIEVLIEGRDKLYDYTVVDTFLECIREEGFLEDSAYPHGNSGE